MILLSGCAAKPPAGGGDPGFWDHLSALCGASFEGRLVEGTEPSDDEIGRQRLVMHVSSCSENEIRIPFRVGDDHSRTWVVTRHAGKLRLKHDHRHADGTPDRVTDYGGDATGDPRSGTQSFPADAHTASLLPAAATNVWTIAIRPRETFTYSLARSNRRFRVDFDLSKPIR